MAQLTWSDDGLGGEATSCQSMIQRQPPHTRLAHLQPAVALQLVVAMLVTREELVATLLTPFRSHHVSRRRKRKLQGFRKCLRKPTDRRCC